MAKLATTGANELKPDADQSRKTRREITQPKHGKRQIIRRRSTDIADREIDIKRTGIATETSPRQIRRGNSIIGGRSKQTADPTKISADQIDSGGNAGPLQSHEIPPARHKPSKIAPARIKKSARKEIGIANSSQEIGRIRPTSDTKTIIN